MLFLLAACTPKPIPAVGLLTPQPADPPGRVVPHPDDAATALFSDDGPLPTVSIELAPEDLASLDAAPLAETYVQGAVVVDGQRFDAVGVRFKGSVGAWFDCTEESTAWNPFDAGGARTCPKLSMKLDFDRYQPDSRLSGLKKVNLHSMNNDPSLFRERLAYGLFAAAGVPSPRTAWVRVERNGDLMGLFLLVEQIDGTFTDSRFADGDGNLYKEVWPTAGPHQPRTDAERALAGLRTNEDDPDVSVDRFLVAGQALGAESLQDRAEALTDWTSIDHVTRYLAVDRLIRADDGPTHFYCLDDDGCANHNFYVYMEEHTDRFWFVPWDLDHAFTLVDQPALDIDSFVHVRYPWDDTTVACEPSPSSIPFFQQLPPACDPLIGTVAELARDRVTAVQHELVLGAFSAAVVDEQFERWERRIRPFVEEAADHDPEQLQVDAWEAGITELRRRIDRFRIGLR